MVAIEIFADMACPFTYVGLSRFAEMRDARGSRVDLNFRAWPLEWVNGRPLDPQVVAEEVDALREQVAPDLFARFNPARFPTTSLPALALAHAAYRSGQRMGEHVSLELRRALFERGSDISDPAVLDDLAGRFGVMVMDSDRRALADDFADGRRRGVKGSPHVFTDETDVFCPFLDIRKTDDGFVISTRPDALAALAVSA